MNKADEIRQYAYDHYARPVIQANETEFIVRTGDVHRDMGLVNRMPAVCSALGTKIMCEKYGLRLIRRDGPQDGACLYFTFEIIKPHPEEERKNIRKESIAPKLGKGEVKKDERSDGPASEADEPFGDAVYLVSCVSRKREAASKAKDLYISDWFVKARRYVESKQRPWFVVSALYGLVDPEKEIEPYDVTLNRMVVKDRRRWAETTLESLLEIDTDSFVFLASNKYREFLEGPLQHADYRVYVPMRGLRIGEQLSWLKRHTP